MLRTSNESRNNSVQTKIALTVIISTSVILSLFGVMSLIKSNSSMNVDDFDYTIINRHLLSRSAADPPPLVAEYDLQLSLPNDLCIHQWLVQRTDDPNINVPSQIPVEVKYGGQTVPNRRSRGQNHDITWHTGDSLIIQVELRTVSNNGGNSGLIQISQRRSGPGKEYPFEYKFASWNSTIQFFVLADHTQYKVSKSYITGEKLKEAPMLKW